MDNFHKEFIMELFMDSTNVTTINGVASAAADLINGNIDNLSSYYDLATEIFEEQHIIEDLMKQSSIRSKKIVCRDKSDYYDNLVPNMAEEEYETTFGMKKATVQFLIEFLKPLEQPGSIPIEKKVHIFLTVLMTDKSYDSVGQLFGLHKSTVSFVFGEIASYLFENRHAYISWQTVEGQHSTRMKVNGRYKFPNCVGFIDACPLIVGSKRDQYDKILLQAVCDESLMFLDVYVGSVGITNKGDVFKQSPLAQELQNFIEYENHILGDSQYKLEINLVTPFSSDEILTIEEMKFNEIHLKARSYIQTAFEVLKNRMHILKYLSKYKMELVHILVYAVCVLHNFVIIHEGSIKEETVISDDIIDINSDIVQTAVEKRQFLCNYINVMDKDSDTDSIR